MEKFKFAGIEIDNLSLEEISDKINNLIQSKRKGYIVTPNVAHIVDLQKDNEFKKSYQNASLILIDSVPLLFALKLLGYKPKGRCAGSDLIYEIFMIANTLSKKVFLLGGVGGSEKIAEEKIRMFYPNIIVNSYSPKFGFENDKMENSKVINKINEFSPDFLLICVGSPKSEKWIYKHINKLNIKLAFCLGAALDFFAGTKKRAPKWMQKVGLEWLWRLIQEPKRLWKRYLIGNTIFLWLVLKELIKKLFVKNYD